MSWAMWVTGRPGNSPTKVVRAAAARLAARGERVVTLEADDIHRALVPRPSGSEIERDLVHRALIFMAATLTEARVAVVIDAAVERPAWLDLARASITHFAEIRLVSGDECADPPDLAVDPGLETIEAAADRIAALPRRWPRLEPPRGPGAVIWITGPPGSGKTTQTSRLAEALTAERVEVAILEWSALRATVLGGAARSEADSDFAHRALAYTAKLMADAGLTVVVDATAPRRAWRSLARALVDSFAEVQLVCPPHVCLARERAARWGPHPCPHRGADAPDIVLEYEYSLSPDLVLDTAARSEWSASADLLRLARRLLRRRLAS